MSLLAALALSSCVDSSVQPCADGTLCGNGLVCDDSHHGCVTPAQLEVCVADTVHCVAAGVDGIGTCYDHVCLASGCGNGFVDADEACDDGNVVGNDACASDCKSILHCGDGVVSAAEQCDDGNLLSNDGCSSGCTTETIAWRVLPMGIDDFVAGHWAYDSLRQRLVVSQRGITWEWSATTSAWSVADVASPRADFIFFDAYRHRVVMVAESSIGVAPDVFEWDGAHWVKRTTHDAPFSLHAATARVRTAYYTPTQDLFVFGDSGGVMRFHSPNSTWSPVPQLASRPGSVVADDAGHRLIAVDDQTYAWDPASSAGWTVVGPAPQAVRDATLVIDYRNGSSRIVALGNGTSTAWQLVGSTWIAAGDLQLDGRLGGFAWFDQAMRHILMYGGTASVTALHDVVDVTTQTTLAHNVGYGDGVWDPMRRQLYIKGSDSQGYIWRDDTWLIDQPNVPCLLFAYEPIKQQTLCLAATGFYRYTDHWVRSAPVAPPDWGAPPSAIGFNYARQTLLLKSELTFEFNTAGAWATVSDTDITWRLGGKLAYDARNQASMFLSGGELFELKAETWTRALRPPSANYRLGENLHIGTVLLAPLTAGEALLERVGTAWYERAPLPLPMDLSDIKIVENNEGRSLFLVETAEGHSHLMLERQFTSAWPAENCLINAVDEDHDGLRAYIDPDCWSTITPATLPH